MPVVRRDDDRAILLPRHTERHSRRHQARPQIRFTAIDGDILGARSRRCVARHSVFHWKPIAMMQSNKPDTANPAMTIRLQAESHWRGVADPERSGNR
jgi:hypothetical protein